MRIDLNADVGEGAGDDRVLMPQITSANIACGVHAGDDETMRATVALAVAHGVAIGAHPSFPDREGFGRRAMHLTPREIERLVVDQIYALAAAADPEGERLRHVKPHGTLYNMAAADSILAQAVARAVGVVDRSLILFGLSGSELIRAGERAGLRTAAEAFADRAYEPNGGLVDRSRPGALIDNADAVVERALRMARQQQVAAIDGSVIRLRVDTICVHGDTTGAAHLAAKIRTALLDAGINVSSVAR
jgi:5-oxoprolinase (ATP-hydrolysing) subunit A